MQKLMGLMRRCIEDYNMIAPGEKVAVGVSGGKDSLVLLQLLAGLRPYMHFELEAIYSSCMDFDAMRKFTRSFCQKIR